jgi:alanine racemase
MRTWDKALPVSDYASPLRLSLDAEALGANWRWLAKESGEANCGAAIKADGYGLGAKQVLKHLVKAGCRDFFVATWAEAKALGDLPEGVSLSVLHGIREEDRELALSMPHRPVLNSLPQVKRWSETGRTFDLMIDTGMSRLGVGIADIWANKLESLAIHTVMSHLASADEDTEQNVSQRALFQGQIPKIKAQRYSLANSAGILLGPDYHFDLTRPGIALYGGIPRKEAMGHIAQVVYPEAQILQRRVLLKGQPIGYNATHIADRHTEVAILNIGYADGILRAFSKKGSANNGQFPFLGRVSMDLIAIDVSSNPNMEEGDWVTIDYDLSTASSKTGLSPYELLTGLGPRFDRIWKNV